MTRPDQTAGRPHAERVFASLNRLAKWRSVFTGWQLGTRSLEDPEAQAIRDHREVTMLLRAETTALVSLLVDKGVFTIDEWDDRLAQESDYLQEAYETRFPGAKATDDGMTFDKRAIPWMSKFPR